MEEIAPMVFNSSSFVGGDDAWTTIREQKKLVEHYRRQAGDLLQIIVGLCLEQGGEMRARDYGIKNAMVHLLPDPNKPGTVLIRYLGDGTNNPNQDPNL